MHKQRRELRELAERLAHVQRVTFRYLESKDPIGALIARDAVAMVAFRVGAAAGGRAAGQAAARAVLQQGARQTAATQRGAAAAARKSTQSGRQRIYLVRDARGIIYVGRSVHPNSRLPTHVRKGKIT